MNTHKPTKPNDEERIINDLKHSLKLMPASQRELFAFEVAKYITKREHLAELRARLDEVEKLDQDAGRDEWLYGYAATRRFELQQQLEEAENN